LSANLDAAREVLHGTIRQTPNDEGNRRAARTFIEDQSMFRRVRLTERLAVAMFETVTPKTRVTRRMENCYDDDGIGLNNVEHGERRATD
jgi:hypothetical protein